MEIKVFDNESELDSFVADEICEYVNKNDQSVIGFATGNTPCGVYKECIKRYRDKKVNFSKMTAFSLDEYVGKSHDDYQSFYNFMKQNLYDHINIEKDKINALNGCAENMDEECRRYEDLIEKNPIDIQLLGIGMDGHIAYNEPGTPFSSITHVMDLHPESVESSLNYGYDHRDEVPRQGVTMGISTIMKSKRLIMMAKGIQKAKLVERMLYGEVSEDFPSSIIQKHPDVLIVLDKEAAEYIKK